jgi:hypothetical protein
VNPWNAKTKVTNYQQARGLALVAGRPRWRGFAPGDMIDYRKFSVMLANVPVEIGFY